jgi:DnaJ-class molecular chaperone
MADRFLAGNGCTCRACGGTGRLVWRSLATGRPVRDAGACAACGGLGRIAYDPARIVADQVAENRRLS